MSSKREHTGNTISDGLAWFRTTLGYLFIVSGVINLLALTGAFYMLQIYDRALTSQSLETLVAISMLAVVLYLFQGVLDIMRSQILVRLGAKADHGLAPLVHRVAVDMPRYGYGPTEASDRIRDVDTLRQFISGQGPVALLDMPWMPIYLAFIYMLNPWLAALVFAGALILFALTLVTEVINRRRSVAIYKSGLVRNAMAESHVRNVEVLRAMGMTETLTQRFDAANREHLRLQMGTSNVSGTFAGLSKVIRMILQSAVLGLGAYFTIKGELSAGAIIAASVASARALAPMDMVIGQWKGLVAARRSYRRLKETIASANKTPPFVDLPQPTHSLKVEKITVAAPGNGTVVLNDVSFSLDAGHAVGLIGPSGSGKSSLARAITGVWPLVRGAVRFDDADISQWDVNAIGRHIGYLPQDVSLMDGTVAENISRFDQEADSLDIIAAANAAGVHEMILRLPLGYETPLGATGAALSAGQRQRIALARAIYCRPFMVVLDEPNSNLDAEGDAALTAAIEKLRELGSIVVIIAHRPSALAAVDYVGVMQSGRLTAFGIKEEIIAKETIVPKPRVAAVPSNRPAVSRMAMGDVS